MAHWRNRFYKTLSNKHVLEIGALNSPAPLSSSNTVEYLDCADADSLQTSFHEVSGITKPNYIVDIAAQPLPFNDESYDVLIMNHVIEHIKNPIGVVLDCFRILKDDGLLIISCPDKRYTFDHNRNLTDISTLVYNYTNKCSTPTREDYLDFISHVSSDKANHKTEDRLTESLIRKEHIYVYTDDSFKNMMLKTVELGKIDVEPIYEAMSSQNNFEYFGVWRITK